jgi:hypothetical protein
MSSPEGFTDLPDEALQRMLTAAVKAYAARQETDPDLYPFTDPDAVTATEVVVAVSKLLEAVEVEVFELGVWQTWGTAERSRT